MLASRCHACDRKGVKITAQEFLVRGCGDFEVVGVQRRLTCTSCGKRGESSITIHLKHSTNGQR